MLDDTDNPRKTPDDCDGFDSVLEIPGGETPREAKVGNQEPNGQMLGGRRCHLIRGIW